jgi:hypothetical protein
LCLLRRQRPGGLLFKGSRHKQFARPYLKKVHKKWLVAWLKVEALSSSPRMAKKKKKRRFGRRHKLRKGHVKEEEKKIAIYKPRKEFSEKFSPIRALILYC